VNAQVGHSQKGRDNTQIIYPPTNPSIAKPMDNNPMQDIGTFEQTCCPKSPKNTEQVICSPQERKVNMIDKDYLAKICDARDTLCAFCENTDLCPKCQVTLLVDDAYAEADDPNDE
jgi:hypothetical protein